MPRLIACRIHQVAYVENLKPLRQSNLLDRVDQAQVALLDKIEKGQLRGLVPLGDRDDETQVGVDELLRRGVPELGPQPAARVCGPASARSRRSAPWPPGPRR